MIVKFLKSSASFKGVGYSFAKILLDKGELMRVKNFDAIQGLSNPRAEDYANYLEVVSDQSKRIVYPQLHVAISTSGRDHGKQELADIAEKWLAGMGYGDHPYMIIFHKDTDNNHVHLVSTRIGWDGKKVKDSFERKKAYEVLNGIMGVGETQKVEKDINQALDYQFNTRAQFMMLLETRGYSVKLKEQTYDLIKYGKIQGTVSLADVDHRIESRTHNKKRLQQLRAIIQKYRSEYNPEICPEKSRLPGGRDGNSIGYTSELAEMLQQKFGLQILFHAKDGKPPYGYTIIDHSQKAVYKGGQLMPLAEFIAPAVVSDPERQPRVILKAQLKDITVFPGQDDGLAYYEKFFPENGPDEIHQSPVYIPPLRLDIANDIDDEAIHGPTRRRKRKARTNTR
jgi:hypothetical protein